ncbi:MAG: hypothetical protein C0393_03530 [Anaerolinea sp.]|nr:hypothetical protein [Anaerolinea sp.]
MGGKRSLYKRVLNLYNDYRRVLLNRKYYGYRLNTVKKWDSVLGIVIAVGASSAVGGWSLWREGIGATIWTVIGGTVALVTIIKPFLQLTKEIERYTKLFIGYGDTFYDLDLIVKEVSETEAFSKALEVSYQQTCDRLRQLAAEDDPQPNEKLRRQCFDEVNAERPVNTFWWPEKGG